MSVCQIEVLELGQAMERPWAQTATEAVVSPNSECACHCFCPVCADSVSNYDAGRASTDGGSDRPAR